MAKPTYNTHYPLPRKAWIKIFDSYGAMSLSEIVHKIAALRRLKNQNRVPEYTVRHWIDMAIRDEILKKAPGIQGKYYLFPLKVAKEPTLNFDNADE